MERSCQPPEAAVPRPEVSQEARRTETAPTSRMDTVARAKEMAGSWAKEAVRGRGEEEQEEQEIISRPRRHRSDSEGESINIQLQLLSVFTPLLTINFTFLYVTF